MKLESYQKRYNRLSKLFEFLIKKTPKNEKSAYYLDKKIKRVDKKLCILETKIFLQLN